MAHLSRKAYTEFKKRTRAVGEAPSGAGSRVSRCLCRPAEEPRPGTGGGGGRGRVGQRRSRSQRNGETEGYGAGQSERVSQGELWEGVAESGDSPQVSSLGKRRVRVGRGAKAGRAKAVALRKILPKKFDKLDWFC